MKADNLAFSLCVLGVVVNCRFEWERPADLHQFSGRHGREGERAGRIAPDFSCLLRLVFLALAKDGCCCLCRSSGLGLHLERCPPASGRILQLPAPAFQLTEADSSASCTDPSTSWSQTPPSCLPLHVFSPFEMWTHTGTLP